MTYGVVRAFQVIQNTY